MEGVQKNTYRFCIVPSCKNTSKSSPGKIFFMVPKGNNTRSIWCKALNRTPVSANSPLYCCEDHFDVKNDTVNYIQYKLMCMDNSHKTILHLKKNVVPYKCINTFENASERPNIKNKSRVGITEEKKLLGNSSTEIISDACIAGGSTSSFTGVQSNDEQVCHKATAENITTQTKRESLKNTFKSSVKNGGQKRKNSCNSFNTSLTQTSHRTKESGDPNNSGSSDDDDDSIGMKSKKRLRSCMVMTIEKNTNTFLGLPEDSFYIVKHLSETTPLRTLDIFITLKKIKLNDSFDVLGTQFGYSQTVVERKFLQSVPLIADKFKEFIFWPSLEEIQLNLPVAFKSRLSKVVSIINAFEIGIEKPTDPTQQSLTWSKFKNCNTLKYLISFTPDGLVNFVSNGYGGSTSEVKIAEECGYLDCVPTNVTVMADRRFRDLSRTFDAKLCAFVLSPSLGKFTKQSKRKDALWTQVDNIMNAMQDFNMLLPHTCVESKLMPIVDEIVIIACGIINFQDALIKKYKQQVFDI